MSITGDQDWGNVERRAVKWALEQVANQSGLPLVTITTEDRLRGAVCEALSLLEQGHPTAAHQILTDSLKIK